MIDFKKTAEEADTDEIDCSPALQTGEPVRHSKPFDLETAKKPFRKYQLKISEMKRQAAALVVQDEGSAQSATEMLAQVSTIVKTMEAERKSVILDPDQFVRGMNAFFRTFRQPLETVTGTLKKSLGDYSYKQELERREDERKAQEAQRKVQAELDKEAEEKKIEPVKMPAMVAPKKKTPVRSESGSSSVRFKKVIEVTDFAGLPDEYKMVNDRALQSALNAGLKNIPGTKISEKPIVSIRGA